MYKHKWYLRQIQEGLIGTLLPSPTHTHTFTPPLPSPYLHPSPHPTTPPPPFPTPHPHLHPSLPHTTPHPRLHPHPHHTLSPHPHLPSFLPTFTCCVLLCFFGPSFYTLVELLILRSISLSFLSHGRVTNGWIHQTLSKLSPHPCPESASEMKYEWHTNVYPDITQLAGQLTDILLFFLPLFPFWSHLNKSLE